jgi:hypothetical protein
MLSALFAASWRNAQRERLLVASIPLSLSLPSFLTFCQSRSRHDSGGIKQGAIHFRARLLDSMRDKHAMAALSSGLSFLVHAAWPDG